MESRKRHSLDGREQVVLAEPLEVGPQVGRALNYKHHVSYEAPGAGRALRPGDHAPRRNHRRRRSHCGMSEVRLRCARTHAGRPCVAVDALVAMIVRGTQGWWVYLHPLSHPVCARLKKDLENPFGGLMWKTELLAELSREKYIESCAQPPFLSGATIPTLVSMGGSGDLVAMQRVRCPCFLKERLGF